MAVRSDAATDRFGYTATSPPAPSAGITVTMWAYLSVDRNDFSSLWRCHSGSGSSTTMNLATGSGGETPCIFSIGNTGGVIGGRPLVVGQWSRVAATCTSTTGIIYVADTNVGATTSATGTVSGGSAPTGFTLAGRSASDSSEWFNGRLAYVRIWSSVLTQAQIEAEWMSTTPVITSNLWAAYPLTSHTDITDHSGNGRNLVAGSTALTTEADPPLGSTVTGTVTAPMGSLASAVIGTPKVLGTVTAGLGALSTNVVGLPKVLGTVTAPMGALTSSVIGLPKVFGTVTAPMGALTTAAIGTPAVRGSVTAGLGSLSTSASGTPTVRGSVTAPMGSLASAVIGTPRVLGTVNAGLGALSSTVAATPDVAGVVSAPLGALAASATGSVTGAANGVATAPLGSLSATALGHRGVHATAAASLASLSAAAVGRRSVVGLADAPIVFAATATGLRLVIGQAAVGLGALTTSATGAGPRQDVTIVATLAAQHSPTAVLSARRWAAVLEVQ